MESLNDVAKINCTTYISVSSNTSSLHFNYSLADVHTVVIGMSVFLLILPFVLFHFRRFPIGPTGAILLGAILMVSTTVLTQANFYEIIGEEGNLRTIFLLLGMMILSQYVAREGIIQYVLTRILKPHLSFANYLWRMTSLSFIVAAFCTNDVACVILTPIILKHWRSQNRPDDELETLLLAIATSANIGSVTTIFGNPQMALIASRTEEVIYLKSQLDLQRTMMYLCLPAIVASALNLACLILHYKIRKEPIRNVTIRNDQITIRNDQITIPLEPRDTSFDEGCTTVTTNRKSRHFGRLLIIILVVMVVLFFVQVDTFRMDIGILPMAAAAILMSLDALLNKISPEAIIMKTDWSVILMFFGIFVWLGGVNATRVPRAIWKAIGLAGRPINDAKTIAVLSFFVIAGSNVFSNVPLTILVLEQLEPCAEQLDLVLYLAWCSTIAGNLTLFGSVANIIVVHKAHETLKFRLSFWAYLKFGFVTTLMIVVTGILIIYGLLRL